MLLRSSRQSKHCYKNCKGFLVSLSCLRYFSTPPSCLHPSWKPSLDGFLKRERLTHPSRFLPRFSPRNFCRTSSKFARGILNPWSGRRISRGLLIVVSPLLILSPTILLRSFVRVQTRSFISRFAVNRVSPENSYYYS